MRNMSRSPCVRMCTIYVYMYIYIYIHIYIYTYVCVCGYVGVICKVVNESSLSAIIKLVGGFQVPVLLDVNGLRTLNPRMAP